MIPLLPLPVSQSTVVGMLAAALISSTTLVDNNNSPTTTPPMLPVVEVIKVYGKLAGTECYGKKALQASSCEITMKDIEKTFQLGSTRTELTDQEFIDSLKQAEFQWPLKPYGIDKSLSKTATMNKGAETKVYMDLLEERGLYDRRDPTGPLLTSLRPQLNRQLQDEGINEEVAKKLFRSIGGENGKLQTTKITEAFQGNMDYYGFLELIGKESITWPY